MPRRAARVTQADVARVIRAAKKELAGAVEVRPDGTILVHLSAVQRDRGGGPLEEDREIVL
jgi:hypothetical protein